MKSRVLVYSQTMRSSLPVVTLLLALSCTPTSEPEEDGQGEAQTSTSADSTTTADASDSADFVPDSEQGSETGLSPVDSHDEDILPYWRYSCVLYCHDGRPDTPAGFLDLGPDAAYDSLVGAPSIQADMPLVTPGSLKDSYLWHKLEGTHLGVGGSGEPMPLLSGPLPPEALERIATWISIGAPP